MCAATEKVTRVLADGDAVRGALETCLREERERLTGQLLTLQLPLCAPRKKAGSYDLDRIRGARRRLRLLTQLVGELPRAHPEWLLPDRAGFGTLVYTKDLGTGRERAYRLVCGEPDPLDASQVSLSSSLGGALVNSRAGDVVTVDTPRETRRLQVLTLTTLSRALGMTPGR